MPTPLFGPQRPTLLAATFDDPVQAERTGRSLVYDLGATDVRVARPGQRYWHAQFEPEPEPGALWRVAARAHLVLGVVGGALGALTGLAVALASPGMGSDADAPAALAQPMSLTAVGVLAGLLASALVAMRPDRRYVIQRVQSALRQRHFAVIVRPRDAGQSERVWELLRESGGHALRSL